MERAPRRRFDFGQVRIDAMRPRSPADIRCRQWREGDTRLRPLRCHMPGKAK
jgi:hypothetical protein